MTATVRQLRPGQGMSLASAVSAYLATLGHDESRGTHRVYSGILRELAARFGPGTDVAELDPAAVARWFEVRYGERSPARWNVALNALRSATAYWSDQGWLTADPVSMLRRRKTAPDRTRALSRAEVDRLLAEAPSLREKVLWRLLYETAARSAEILALDVEDLDLPNRSARVRRKGGAMDVIVWQTGTARLLPRLLGGRKTGPVFLTDRKARVELPASDLDPASGKARLSYRQAADLFKAASGGATLHQLRHSALTHAAEEGVSTPMLMARSGHTSVRSLVRYARVSAEALRHHQDATDPARRR